jgi:hypothetical protein
MLFLVEVRRKQKDETNCDQTGWMLAHGALNASQFLGVEMVEADVRAVQHLGTVAHQHKFSRLPSN